MIMYLLRFLSLIWMGLIFYLSSLSRSDLQDLPHISDILGHGLLYIVLGGLLYYSARRQQGWWAVLVSAFFGLSDEFHQSFVPGRTPEPKDLIVDTAAALAAVLVIKIVVYLRPTKGRLK